MVLKRNQDMIPVGGIKSPIAANAEFARRIGDKCFCNAVCKCGKRKSK